jgi:hypothetical protein
MSKLFLIIIVLAGILFFAVYALRQGFGTGTELIGTTTLPANASYSYANASEDMIFITSPKPGENVTSTIVIKGFARGTWYFEAVFPVVVENAGGMVIGEGQGKAEGDWTTNSFVPFTAEVDLKTPYTGVAQVVLKKDNPSGDPSRDASISFPVVIQ